LHYQTATHTTLLERVSAGNDPVAWGEFCDRYGQLIRLFCIRRALQAADVDDVQQDVLLALSKAMPGFRYDPEKGKFRGYLKTIVIHAIYKKQFQNRGVRDLSAVDEATRAGAADANVENDWEAQWRQYHVRQAMTTIENEFNATDVDAFERYGLLGHDPARVAADLSLGVDSVYQAKSRIMKRLSALIAQQIAEEG